MFNFHEGGCTIGMLRPIGTNALSLASESSNVRAEDLSEKIRLERIDWMIGVVREVIEESADSLGLKIHLTEHQLHADVEGTGIVSKCRARNIGEKDLLVTFDPGATELSFVSGQLTNPLRRGLIVYSSQDFLDDELEILGATALPLISLQARRSATRLQRMFPITISLNENTDLKPTAITGIRKALTYPFIPPPPRPT